MSFILSFLILREGVALINKSIFDSCENCPSFTVSRKAMRDYRAAKKLEKEYYKKHNPTSYFPFNKMEPGEELPF